MNCPACGTPLITLEYDDIEVDYCTECQGIWLDSGELELLLGESEGARGWLVGGVPASEKARACPICRKDMEKVATVGGVELTYDRCKLGHGLWFDHGELEAVLRAGASADQEVQKRLRAMFPDWTGAAEQPGGGQSH